VSMDRLGESAGVVFPCGPWLLTADFVVWWRCPLELCECVLATAGREMWLAANRLMSREKCAACSFLDSACSWWYGMLQRLYI
jgi:hypothetical protein